MRDAETACAVDSMYIGVHVHGGAVSRLICTEDNTLYIYSILIKNAFVLYNRIRCALTEFCLVVIVYTSFIRGYR